MRRFLIGFFYVAVGCVMILAAGDIALGYIGGIMLILGGAMFGALPPANKTK